MKTLVIVLTYNEVDNIGRLIPAILQHMPHASVLIVDDNSPDGPTQAVRTLATQILPRLRIELNMFDNAANGDAVIHFADPTWRQVATIRQRRRGFTV